MSERIQRFALCAGARAIRTIAQTAIATIGTATVLGAVDWRMVASASVLSGILSVLTSIVTGLPEVEMELEDIEDVEEEDEDIEERSESDQGI